MIYRSFLARLLLFVAFSLNQIALYRAIELTRQGKDSEMRLEG
jgi:hypothetical protein